MHVYIYTYYMYPRTSPFFHGPTPLHPHHPQGGSSGIGRAIVDRLAAQGFNVVVVAVDDALLKESVAELKAQFTGQQVRLDGWSAPGGIGTFFDILVGVP